VALFFNNQGVGCRVQGWDQLGFGDWGLGVMVGLKRTLGIKRNWVKRSELCEVTYTLGHDQRGGSGDHSIN